MHASAILLFLALNILHSISGPVKPISVYDKILQLATDEQYKCPYLRKSPIVVPKPKFLEYCPSYEIARNATEWRKYEEPNILCMLYFESFKQLCAESRDFKEATITSLFTAEVLNSNEPVEKTCKMIMDAKKPQSVESKLVVEVMSHQKTCERLCSDVKMVVSDACKWSSLMLNIAGHPELTSAQKPKVTTGNVVVAPIAADIVNPSEKLVTTPTTVGPETDSLKTNNLHEVVNNMHAGEVTNNILHPGHPMDKILPGQSDEQVATKPPHQILKTNKGTTGQEKQQIEQGNNQPREKSNEQQPKQPNMSNEQENQQQQSTGLENNKSQQPNPQAVATKPTSVTKQTQPQVVAEPEPVQPPVSPELPKVGKVTEEVHTEVSEQTVPLVVTNDAEKTDDKAPVPPQDIPDDAEKPGDKSQFAVQDVSDAANVNIEETMPKGIDEDDEDLEEEYSPMDIGVKQKQVDKSKPHETDGDSLNPYTSQIDEDDSYFFSYFMMICIVFVLGYVGYHNKQKLLALVLEGRKGKRQQRRRPNSANYHKLDSNLEEAVTSACNKNTANVIY